MTKNELYGFLTSLVEDHRNTTNFCEGLKYRKNFFRIETFINSLLDITDKEIDIVSCFDYESEDEFINSFRFISIYNQNQLFNVITSNLNIFEENILIELTDELIEIRFL